VAAVGGVRPETRYARSGDLNIAYQVVSEGALDLVYIPGWVSNIELMWEEPGHARFLRRLASFSRLIVFDKRGTGLSDRVPLDRLPTLEQRMDDLRAVMDAVGSERAALFGHSEGGNMSILFAATYPDRTAALVTYGIFASRLRKDDYPWGRTLEEREREYELLPRAWGGPVDIETLAPSRAGDPAFRDWWAAYLRAGASPSAALALLKMNSLIDVREILGSIRVPTLVLHRRDEREAKVEEARYIAARIPGAKYVELAGQDHLFWVGEQHAVVDEIEEFLTGARPVPELDRILATVLFTDIAGSTERAAELGDRRWRELLDRHHALVRRELERHRGHEVDTAGDGFFARFDGPARAVRCASAIRDAVRPLGIEIRAGLHTGELELAGEKAGGIAVHIGARVAGQAEPGEIVVSSTVKDLVAGSGIEFEDRGVRPLKGVPGEWHLFAVRG
jgi:pimeloyl-ACP methyl ester carboxylesterase